MNLNPIAMFLVLFASVPSVVSQNVTSFPATIPASPITSIAPLSTISTTASTAKGEPTTTLPKTKPTNPTVESPTTAIPPRPPTGREKANQDLETQKGDSSSFFILIPVLLGGLAIFMIGSALFHSKKKKEECLNVLSDTAPLPEIMSAKPAYVVPPPTFTYADLNGQRRGSPAPSQHTAMSQADSFGLPPNQNIYSNGYYQSRKPSTDTSVHSSTGLIHYPHIHRPMTPAYFESEDTYSTTSSSMIRPFGGYPNQDPNHLQHQEPPSLTSYPGYHPPADYYLDIHSGYQTPQTQMHRQARPQPFYRPLEKARYQDDDSFHRFQQ